MFAGYNRYNTAVNYWHRVTRIPAPLRALLAAGVRTVPPEAWDAITGLLPKRARDVLSGRRLYKAAGSFRYRDADSFYRAIVTQWDNPDAMVPQGHEPHGILWDKRVSSDVPDFVERMQFFDLVTYLPDDILTKVDRASMDVALEVRVPLLDHRVVDFAFRLPTHQKMRAGQGKWLLRQVLDRHVPRALVERPKQGFGVPIVSWLRGPLRAWAEDLLDARRLKEGGLVDPAPVRRVWAAHLNGGRNLEYPLWTVLMLEAWRRRWSV